VARLLINYFDLSKMVRVIVLIKLLIFWIQLDTS